MSKFVKFINNAAEHRGNPIYINVEQISAFYELASQEGGSLKTFIYGGQTGVVWEVEESLSQVRKIIEDIK
jgi:hypothetical protein